MERDNRDGESLFRVLVALAVAAALLCARGSALGQGLISANYKLNWEKNVDKTGAETLDTYTYTHILETKYRGFLSPIIENEILLKIEQEVNSDRDPRSTTRVFPGINLSYKGSYWNAGVKRTIEESNEPSTERITADSYFVEVFLVPPRVTLPDLKAKYTLDQDFESGATDTSKHSIILSSIYQPMEWLVVKGEYSRDLNDDNLVADSDTEEETFSGTFGIRHFISEKAKIDSEFRTEISRGATLLDTGGARDQKEEQTHTWKNKVSFRPFSNTNIDGSYDFDLKQDIVSREHSYSKNWKANIGQRISIFNLSGDFNRMITEERHTADDFEKTEDTWTVQGSVIFSKHLNFSMTYEWKDTQEIFLQDSTKDTTSGSVRRSVTWTGVITPFWNANATYEKTDTTEKDVTTTVDTRFSFQSLFDFRTLNLSLTPTYEFTSKEDRQLTPIEETEIRDFRFNIGWKIFSTNNMQSSINHTYGRKTDSSQGTIERTDNSNGTLIWNLPLEGWNVGFDVTRTAIDTSDDDQPPDITSTFGLKADYNYKLFTWNMNYKYDKTRLTDNSETLDFKIGWKAPRWDVSVLYSYNKVFSEVLNEGYSVSFEFKYTL